MANGIHTANRKARQRDREDLATTASTRGEFSARVEKDLRDARLHLRAHYRPAQEDRAQQAGS